jgi:antitoxin (DNA-binding transcriptional repressor) of toxin-antitoxin stability system
MTATECSRNFSSVLDKLEFGREPVEIVRNKHVVAKMIPGTRALSARDVMADLFGILSDEEGSEWAADCREADQTLAKEMRDPWA